MDNETDDAGSGGGSIDQVREILFGSQQREVNTRFKQMDEAIQRAGRESREFLETMRSEFEQRMDERDREMLERLETLQSRAEEISADVSTMTDRLGEAESAIREDLDRQATRQQARLDDLRTDVEAALRRLEGEKTGRSELGAYLLELGSRLTGEPGHTNGAGAPMTEATAIPDARVGEE